MRIAVPADVAGVKLRRLVEGDAEAFAAHVAADLVHLGEFLPWPAKTAEVAGAAAWLGPYEREEEGRIGAYGAWEDARLVGGGVLMHHEPVMGQVEVGIWVTSAAEGRGLATDICTALLGLARGSLRVERVVWKSVTRNRRSRCLAEKLGFVHEGTLRSDYVLRGERLDTDLFSLVGAELDR